MDRKKRKLLVLLAVLAGLLAGAAALYGRLSDEVDTGPALQAPVTEDETQARPDTQKERVQAPDFTVCDAEGNTLRLSDLRGKPVIVNFWASWCGPCQREMPDFEDAWLAYGEEVAFLMVNLTDGKRETAETAMAFLAETEYTFPVYFDTDLSAAITYGVNSIPATYLIDAEGNAVARAPGMLNRETLQLCIDLLLGEPTA